jgi:hypothetical protein
VLVEYGPGGYSLGHTHAKSPFIYATVLEGAIRSQINDGPVIYEARQSFSELPGDRHAVSANASETQPANLRGVRGGHERDGADNPIRELTVMVIASVVAAAPVTCNCRALAIGPFGYHCAPDFAFGRDRAAFPPHQHK